MLRVYLLTFLSSNLKELIIVMGVSGSGKTTIGKQLALALDIPFFDADDFHPKSNIEKMSNGIPLNDEDRLPWLQNLNRHLIAHKNSGAVLACSALKESYREILSEGIFIDWVYLKADFDLIKERMLDRKDHFMPLELLQSQFNTLETPNYGIHVSNTSTPTEIVKKILSNLTKNHNSYFGVYGLGVMGKSLALNMLNKGFSLSVYNIDTPNEKNVVSNFLESAKNDLLMGYTDAKKFVDSLARPRKILLMVKAGDVVDIVIKQLTPFLNEGDIIIDGGNSHYLDTKQRIEELKAKGIHFVGLGVSGGEEGALKGPSLMPGGNIEAYHEISDVLEAIAAKDKSNKPCCTFIGNEGAGHFVKMVHNGIEYGEMQLLAELYHLLRKQLTYEEIAKVFNEWNKGEQSSYLLEITAKILLVKEGNNYLLDQILDKAGNKGTGSWSSIAALQNGLPTTVKTAAVFARYISSFKNDRTWLSGELDNLADENQLIDLDTLKEAYDFARTINMHQGLELIRKTSEENTWDIHLTEVLRIWTNGCIIKSERLEIWKDVIANSQSLLADKKTIIALNQQEVAVRNILKTALNNRIAVPCLWAAYNYWVGMTTKNSSANMIQAQRDYFGAHTYQRIDKDESQFFHTNWQLND